jgi:hypothetical protein
VDAGTVRFLREYMDPDYAHSVSAGSAGTGSAYGDGGGGGGDARVAETLKRLGHD